MTVLGNYISIKHGFAFKGEHIVSVNNGVVLVTPGNFAVGGGFQEKKCKYYDGEYNDEYVLHADDLIVTMTDLSKQGDTLGYGALVPYKKNRVYLHNQRIGLVKIISPDIDKGFLYWFLRTPFYHNTVVSTSTGSTVKHTSPARICDVPIVLPSIQEQKRISSALFAFDRKIALNNKINENLYDQAKAIFYESFINIGSIPEGWKKGNLLDIANYLNGLAMQKYRPKENEEGIPVLKIKELRQGSCDSSSELCSPNIKHEYIIRDGDVIFSWSGSLLVDIWCGGTCGLNQHLFKVTSDTYDKWFYYLWTAYHLDRFIAIAADKATTMGHIKRGELAKAEVLIPSEEDYKKINAVMNPIFELTIANRIETRKLAELRDELLPRLMNGEIDVDGI